MVRAFWVAVVLAAGHVSARADGDTPWQKDEAKKVHVCEYVYTPKAAKKAEHKQTVAVYYGDADRAGWAYYYNAKNEPWARCAVPGNPKYEAGVMHWQALKPDAKGYEPFKDVKGDPYPAGYCPAPKDGKSPIPDLPLPPK